MSPPRLELRGISKQFGSVQAVRGADFALGSAELHALLGENGAGKSTLMHVAAGLVRADQGQIFRDGRPVALTAPRDARRLGIGMVYQHFTSVPGFTIAENIALAAGWPVRPTELRTRVAALVARLGLTLDPGARAETLSVADLERLEILRVLASDASVLLLDEPTGSLAPADAEEFLRFVRRLVDAGASAVLITHKLDEAVRFADRITVLRRGQVVASGPAGSFNRGDLASAMLGSAAGPTVTIPETRIPGSAVVQAEGLSVAPLAGGPGLIEGTFEVRSGEVVGIASIEGNGAAELLRAVAGRAAPGGGVLRVEQPAALVPEDRTRDGLIGGFSVLDNLTLGLGEAAPWIRGGRIDNKAGESECRRIMDQYGILANGPRALAASLSGGNQQKLILARAIELHPRVLVAENPARGLDIRAAESAFRQLREAAAGGAGVLVHSSDLDELVSWCDRVLVVALGRVITLAPGAAREDIGRRMLGQ